MKKDLEKEYVTLLIDIIASNKYVKVYDKNEELSYLKYWNVNNLHDCAMFQMLTLNGFEWVEDTYQLNEDFIKSYNEQVDEGYFLEVFQYP